MKCLKTWFINLMKVLGALVNPKGMTNHVGERSNFKKKSTHTQDHGDA